MIKNWCHFNFKIDENLIKNRSKNDVEFKVGFGIGIFWIFCRFWIYFGSKNGGVEPRKSVLEAFPTSKWTPKAVWTLLGTVLGTFLKNFWSILTKIMCLSLSSTRTQASKGPRRVTRSVNNLRIWGVPWDSLRLVS